MSLISATDVEVQKPVNVIFNEMLLRNARARAPYYVGTQAGSLTESRGSATIKWRRYNSELDNASGVSPKLTPLAELTGNAAYGQGRAASAVHFTDVTATVQKFGDYHILNEEVEIFNFNNTFAGIMRPLSIAAGRTANQLQRNVGEDNATKDFAGGVASDALVATAVAEADLKRVINVLNRQSGITFTPMTTGSENVGTTPTLPSYWAICHPDVAEDVAGLTGFKSVETYAGQVQIAPFEFGYFGRAGQGIRFLQTEDASIDLDAGVVTASAPTLRFNSTNVDLYTILIFGMESIGAVGLGQSYGTEAYETGDDIPAIELLVSNRQASAADPFAEIRTMAYKLWHTGAILNANWSRALRVGATAL